MLLAIALIVLGVLIVGVVSWLALRPPSGSGLLEEGAANGRDTDPDNGREGGELSLIHI